MRLLLALNDRYCSTPDGSVWTERSTWPYRSLARYLTVFSQVTAVARVRPVQTPPPGAERADGSGVSFVDVPYFVGPTGYVRVRGAVQQALRGVVKPGDALILRMPAWHLSGAMANHLPRRDYPYAVEVCGDAAEQLAARSSWHPLPRIMGWSIARRTRRCCAGAVAASYVSRHFLQERYPTAPGAFTVGECSNVDLPEEAFVPAPRTFQHPARKVIFVGTLENLNKGPDLLLEAVARCGAAGTPFDVTFVGHGKFKSKLRQAAHTLGLAERVRFLGQLSSGSAVREQLDAADLFVLPSHSDGLPRGVLEAMARGLPCISTAVGGIPELLPAECLVAPDNVDQLAARLGEVASNPARLSSMSARNWGFAAGFAADRLKQRRAEFFRFLHDRTGAYARAA